MIKGVKKEKINNQWNRKSCEANCNEEAIVQIRLLGYEKKNKQVN